MLIKNIGKYWEKLKKKLRTKWKRKNVFGVRENHHHHHHHHRQFQTALTWVPDELESRWGIMVNLVMCVIPGQGNSKILNLVKSGSLIVLSFYIYQTVRKQVRATLFDQSLLFDSFLLKSVVPE